MNIVILKKAEEMLRSKLQAQQFLRVTVVEGGCAGLTYQAEISDVMREGESVVKEYGPIRIVSDAKGEVYLEGLVIDYSDDLIAGGLQFTNASTKKTCGCGQSFSLVGFPEIKEGDCNKK